MKKINKTAKVKSNGVKAKEGQTKTHPSFWERISQKGYNPMLEGVRWSEKYDPELARIFGNVPVFLQKVIVVIAILLLGSSLKGKFLSRIIKG